MTDERLIEEAAKAIRETHLSGAWPELQETDREYRREQARAALAVFEKAHTPTDDERIAEIASTLRPTPGDRDGVARARAVLDDEREALAEPSDPPVILEMAAGFTKPDALTRLVALMMTTWGERDPRSEVAQYPASYVATFTDMARAILAEPLDEPSDAQNPGVTYDDIGGM